MKRMGQPPGTGDSRAAGRLQAVAAIAALVFVSVVVLRTSDAAFSATTSNSSNDLAAGDVNLSDDDTGSAMFSVTDLVPGDTVQECIEVTYTGSVTASTPGAVKLYSGGYTDSGDFGDYLNLTVDEGTGGSYGDCTGFSLGSTLLSSTALSTFDGTYTDYASGLTGWTPSASPQARTYRVTFELDAATPNAEEGEDVSGLTFTWEVQS